MTSSNQKDILNMLETKNITVEASIPRIAMPKSTVWITPDNITSSEREKIVKAVLGEENVTVSNKDNKRQYTMNTKQLMFDYNKVVYIDTGPNRRVENINEKKAKKEADLFLKKLTLGNNFKRAKVSSKKEGSIFYVTYYETIDFLPVFDSYVEVLVSERGVIYAQAYKVKVTKTDVTSKYIYPADKVLFGIEDYLDNSEFLDPSETADASQTPDLSEPIVITGITLGYGLSEGQRVDLFEEEAVPVYKIDILNKNEPIFINAYTNNIQ